MSESIPSLPSTSVNKLVDPYIDIGNLLLIDNDPISTLNSEGTISESKQLCVARDNVQCLFNKIWELETEKVEESVCVKLPAPSFRIPREKVLPQKRELTKWERYAKDKGIRKRTKSKKIFDEPSGEWKPAFGHRRGNDPTKDWLIEIPDHKDPMVDYFAERNKKKQERVDKNELQRLRNIQRSMKKRMPDLPDPARMGIGVEPEKRTKTELISQVDRARYSTASVGKFQPVLKDEKAPKKKGKINKFSPNEAGVSDERKRQLDIFLRLSAKKPILDETKLRSASGGDENQQSKDRRRSAKGARPRQKSAIHKQRFFQKTMKERKKTRGNVRKPLKTGKGHKNNSA